MVDLSEDLRLSLESLGNVKKVTAKKPKSFNELPHITYYEAQNSPIWYADDKEYLWEVIYDIDIFASNLREVRKIDREVYEALSVIGFKKVYSKEETDNDTVRHGLSRYRYIGS